MPAAASIQRHINPVYGSYFADPFVWKHQEVYYAIGTGGLEAAGQTVDKVFPVLQSTDFLQWTFASNALLRPDPKLGATFWAPAVAFNEGRFYLYYSVGDGDKHHQLRVAASDSPQGPYQDTGRALTELASCPFAIDPHPFRDDDGQWYLFHARDFLDQEDGARAGTALVVNRMKSMTEIAGELRVVLRARNDWQRFQRARLMYGRVWDWHTVEGPCPVKHGGFYYCFYSGGCWETENYGVDYCMADHVEGPYFASGDGAGPRVLRTIPGRLLGPGHNSIIQGPESQTDYIVYHAWDKQMRIRRMCIDKLLWTLQGPRCEPTFWGAGSTQ